MKTGVVTDKRFMDHDMGAYHVESPHRIEVLNRMLEEDPPIPYLPIEPRPATDEEVGWVHEKGYIDLVRSTAGKTVPLDMDATAGPKTFATALLAAGGFLKSLDLIMDGTVRNAFALVRPPGHHAEASQALGFCFFNNVAIGAEHLVRNHGLRRVLVVDWDLHHGNGTEHAFYARRDVMYFSTHQVPLYPGTGAARDFGAGDGLGFNLNVPLLAGKGDADYLHIFEKILDPVAAQFEPEFILVSAGFDIAAGDPLGGMAVTPAGFGLLTASLMAMAERTAAGRLALVLEGGYDLRALRDSVREVLKMLAKRDRPRPILAKRDSPLPRSGSGRSEGQSPYGRQSPSLRVELEDPLRTFRRKWDIPAA
ncbi:MAG: histone deacetylase [Candidatus Aminicenantes bacterium]|nr:histone deacetylase [Candidatus Aminicenantes bacterium]